MLDTHIFTKDRYGSKKNWPLKRGQYISQMHIDCMVSNYSVCFAPKVLKTYENKYNRSYNQLFLKIVKKFYNIHNIKILIYKYYYRF
jgi:hypothetical protein